MRASLVLALFLLTALAAPSVLAQSENEALSAPLPEADGSLLEAASLNYTASIGAGARSIELNVRRNVERASLDGEPVWRVVESMVMPTGSAVDTFEVHEATLRPLRRSLGGAGTTIRLSFEDDRVQGRFSAVGQNDVIDTGLEAPVFADGAGLELAIAALPLSEGYDAIVRTFDPHSAEVRAIQLTVTGKESITTDAGTFDTLTLELEPLDESPAGEATLHVLLEAPHYLVKGSYRLPSHIGDGTMTVELAYAD